MHGSRTVLFSLYLLVISLHDAEATLRSTGWTSACVPEFSPKYYDPAVEDSVVLAHFEDEDPEEQLVLYNALAQRSIDTDCVPFRKYLAIHLGLSKDLYMHTSKTAQHEWGNRYRTRKGDWVLIDQGTAELGETRIDREHELKVTASLRSARSVHSPGSPRQE
ncbi:hypothetical protein C8Q74DRAFT_1316919 [Fomes fomentarius]|nr:hypothetical protein C8Q74DRAFT_1316919 [Fomes fomentarius]